MESEVDQLVEMGATAAQARAALKRYKDVMQAAEHIFEGAFDDIVDDDGDTSMTPAGSSRVMNGTKVSGLATPDEEDEPESAPMEDDEDADLGEDDDDYVDYDSDEGVNVTTQETSRALSDPYAGIFFSKDRREEVIEVEEPPEMYHVPGTDQYLKLMPQGQWMKGCPEGGEQNFLFGLYNELSFESCRCPQGCGATIQRKKADFFVLYPTFQEYIDHLRDIIRARCARCSKEFCLACGESFNSPKIFDSTSAENIDLLHCSNIQGVTLGIGLAMLEQMYHDQTHESSLSDERSRTSKKRKVETVTTMPSMQPSIDYDDDDDIYPVHTGVTKKAKGGIGYAGDQKEDTTGQAAALAQQNAKDANLGGLMSSIRVFLPNLHRNGGAQASDYLVHPTALAHLRRRFNNICSSLLRNDSLTDMSDRSAVYFELFEWLETISNHEALASMMAMPIMVVQSVKTKTPKKSADGTPPPRERAVVYEGSAGPRELMEAIVIQAQAAIKGLEGAKQAEIEPAEMTEEQKRVTSDAKGKKKEVVAVALSEENEKLLNFCNRILATANAIDRALSEVKGDAFLKRLHKSLPKIHRASEDTDEVFVDAGATDEATRKTYLEWANRVRFEYCDLSIPVHDTDKKRSPDEPPNYKFYFNNEARMLASADIPKRSLAIAKELAVLTTNLPVAWDSSIFLRVDESRVDIIKALIIGPQGTPYENGCFLFDIFLGNSYNQSPPAVKYMTTNGGKYRFNPNLYADGKVCLSLLGTWQGPGWVAGKSTLLQVLISIQSMILCDEPYLNEPGWANGAGTPPSIAYSANVRRMVVRTAMLGNLRNPPEPFGDVIRTHFRLKARSIMAQLDKWLAQDDGRATLPDGAASGHGPAGSSSAAFQADIDELKRVLQGLQHGKAV